MISATTIGLGLTVGKEIIDRIASGWGGGDMKDLLGEQAGAYADALMQRRDEGATFLPAEKFAMFAEKFPEAADWLKIAMERDESVSFLVVFLKSVQAKLDNPKNNDNLAARN